MYGQSVKYIISNLLLFIIKEQNNMAASCDSQIQCKKKYLFCINVDEQQNEICIWISGPAFQNWSNGF